MTGAEKKDLMISVGEEEFKFDMLVGTEDPRAIDVRDLYKNAGVFTYDPGFMSTASCESRITYIDGMKGILRYRGYPIEELAEKSNFIEAAHLLLKGDLPNKDELASFEHDITYHTLVHEQLQFLFRAFPRKAHPMAIMVGAVASLSAFYHDETNKMDERGRELACIKMIAKVPTLAAFAYKYSIGQPFIYPENSLSVTGNFLRMMFGVPCEDYQLNTVVEDALDKIFILHMDHEQNASTSTVRLAGSSGANPYACIASGIASLWGPAHGGANEEVIKMLEKIGTKDKIPEFIARAKDPKDSFRLMGFGHRVYKNYDPRAKVLKATCHDVLNELGIDDPLLEVALELERIALEDEYFIERKLYPNVDFYSGIIYKAINIPVQMFTVMFAIARTVGWVSQWKEMMEDKDAKIGRPRQIYIGENLRSYKPLKKRK